MSDCCYVEVSAMSRSLVQRSPIECGVSSVMEEPYTGVFGPPALSSHGKKIFNK